MAQQQFIRTQVQVPAEISSLIQTETKARQAQFTSIQKIQLT